VVRKVVLLYLMLIWIESTAVTIHCGRTGQTHKFI